MIDGATMRKPQDPQTHKSGHSQSKFILNEPGHSQSMFIIKNGTQDPSDPAHKGERRLLKNGMSSVARHMLTYTSLHTRVLERESMYTLYVNIVGLYIHVCLSHIRIH